MRYVTLNISGPSISRAQRLLEFLPCLSADVLVLTETRNTDGTRLLLEGLRRSGATVVETGMVKAGERGVAVVTAKSHQYVAQVPVDVDLAHRLVVARLGVEQPITVIGTYVPSRDASQEKITRKRTFLRQLSQVAYSFQSERVVLLGDLNVVSRSHSPRYSAFRSWEYEAFDELKLTGFVDAHTSLYPDVQVHSWIGRKGAGYRYDYAFVSAALSGDVIGSEYLHEPRLHGLTDHAAVALTLADRLAPVGRIGPSDRSLVRSY